jgi:imidazolonepropionase-like amidohydrolase
MRGMTQTLALKAGRVFDGYVVQEGATVVVTDGVVTAVERGEVPGALDLGDDVTLMPGLVDTHVHLVFSGELDLLGGLDLDDEALLVRMREAADLTLHKGVTTVRDLGDRSFLAAQVGGPLTVLAAGPPLTTVGGHCHFLGGEVDGLDAILRAVEVRAEMGCAVVKVMASGGNITPGTTPFDTQFTLPELKAVVAEAHRLGMHTAAHVHAPASIVNALDAGFDTLEHVSFATEQGAYADPAVLKRIVDDQVVLSATMGSLPGAVPPPAIAERMVQVRKNWLQLATDGARIVVGTDAGIGPGKPHGVLPHALRDLAVGMSGLDPLRAVTSAAAEAIGLGGRKGCLQPGADADLLAVRGDPAIDPEAMHEVVGVWARGERLRR